MKLPSTLKAIVEEQPHTLLFATVSGAHLYGFPSPDSDYDLRGVHILPLEDCIGLRDGPATIESSCLRDGLEVDLVTHDVKKFFALLLRPNGYVLEQLFSPLIVATGGDHEELKSLARGCVTRRHVSHYRGFAHNQWRLYKKENPARVKPLLYLYRVLLTGIRLMETGEVEANLVRLNREYALPYVPDLIERKTGGTEGAVMEGAEIEFHAREYARLLGKLETSAERSALPDEPSSEAALHALLLRLRLGRV